MRIALTGGNGRIGQAIAAEALRQGHSVVSIDRTPSSGTAEEGVRSVAADLADYDALVAAFEGCDALLHMGAIPSPGQHPDHVVHNNNVVGSYNALRAAAEHGITRICQASSVNAIGLSYSRAPRFDYFPVDEAHANYGEDPYALSKWICEQQADSFVRRYEDMRIASLRFHWVVPDRATALTARGTPGTEVARHLWGYTRMDAAVAASLLSLTAEFEGHEAFYIVAPDTAIEAASLELAGRYFPEVPVRGDLSGNRSFFNSSKAERVLGWRHGDGGAG